MTNDEDPRTPEEGLAGKGGVGVRAARVISGSGRGGSNGRGGNGGNGGRDGSGGRSGKVMIVLINRIINFGKGCSLISY